MAHRVAIDCSRVLSECPRAPWASQRCCLIEGGGKAAGFKGPHNFLLRKGSTSDGPRGHPSSDTSATLMETVLDDLRSILAVIANCNIRSYPLIAFTRPLLDPTGFGLLPTHLVEIIPCFMKAQRVAVLHTRILRLSMLGTIPDITRVVMTKGLEASPMCYGYTT